MFTDIQIEEDVRAALDATEDHRPLRFGVPPKLPEPISPALVEHAEERTRRPEPRRRSDHALRRLDDVRVPAHHLVRVLDRARASARDAGADGRAADSMTGVHATAR
jgi:hypothetical protein